MFGLSAISAPCRLPLVRRVLVCGLLLAAWASGMSGAWAAPTASGARIGHNKAATRFVLDLDQAIDYRIFTLADPYRVVIDLPETTWKIGGGGRASGGGLISQYRYGLFRPGTSRVVLDLGKPAAVRRAFLLPPRGNNRYYRFVLDLAGVGRAAFVGKVGTVFGDRKEPPSKPLKSPPPATRKDRRIIAIDAGHGGVDPGSAGIVGPPEKVITLAIAREVRRQLSGHGRYKVVLTRDRDIYVGLRERVARARRAGADLLISIHTDSLVDSRRNRRVRGATVYTLSETASDQEAAALAAKENRSDVIAGVDLARESDDVTNILIDLAQRETMNYSARFAEILVPELRRRVVLRSNSHRFAGFRVLKAPDIPSVLIEMGYLSNRKDARALNSKEGRQKIAEAIVRATGAYFRQRQAALCCHNTATISK